VQVTVYIGINDTGVHFVHQLRMFNLLT